MPRVIRRQSHRMVKVLIGAWEQGIFIGKLAVLWCLVGVLLLAFVFCCISADGTIAGTHVHSLMSRANAKTLRRKPRAKTQLSKLD